MRAVVFVSTLLGLLTALFAATAAVTWVAMSLVIEVLRWLGLVEDDQEPP